MVRNKPSQVMKSVLFIYRTHLYIYNYDRFYFNTMCLGFTDEHCILRISFHQNSHQQKRCALSHHSYIDTINSLIAIYNRAD